MDKGDIFQQLQKILAKEFDLDPAMLVPEARLHEDLSLDSIDAVDLIVNLKSLLQVQFSPEVFKSVKTLQDVVDAVHSIMNTEKK
ncbi:MAG: phosphopantetheine-binding protein [Candidatus Fibromonas sp.]|jgi:acyl carrier protein|nr:phosphopantetheine-binding protein [Candidatus Fibromonas sp.]